MSGLRGARTGAAHHVLAPQDAVDCGRGGRRTGGEVASEITHRRRLHGESVGERVRDDVERTCDLDLRVVLEQFLELLDGVRREFRSHFSLIAFRPRYLQR